MAAFSGLFAHSGDLCLGRSRLFLDRSILVDNEGLHGMVEKCSKTGLSSGSHVLYITGFQAGGGVGMVATYSGPDTGMSKVLIKSGFAPSMVVQNRYFGKCDPTAQGDITKFTICMFRSDVGLVSIPKIGQADSGNSRLHYIGKGMTSSIDIRNVDRFRAVVPGVPGADYAWAIYGRLKVTSGGKYLLCITSDDG